MYLCRYVLLQGLSGTAGGFLQIVPLAIYYVKLYLLGSTPRSVYNIKYGSRSVAWGTTFPGLTLLVVIGESIITVDFEVLDLPTIARSSGILDHFPDHQRFRLCHILCVLHALQVFVFVAVSTISGERYGWTVLPQSNPAYLRWVVCSTGLPVRVVLFGSGYEWECQCCSGGCSYDRLDRVHCTFFCMPLASTYDLQTYFFPYSSSSKC